MMNCTAKYHGTYSSVRHHGCVCPTAQVVYRRKRKMYDVATQRGVSLRVPAVGTIRRIQALQRLGYSAVELKARVGHSTASRQNLLPGSRRGTGRINAGTAAKWKAVYEELCGIPATGPQAARLRKMAENRGYASPLAWDNIDDPDEVAQTALEVRRQKDRARKRSPGYRSRINAQNYQRRKAREEEVAA